jgi:hypothetical protein
MLDEQIFKTQNIRDKLFVLLFLYSKNMNKNLATIEIDIAVYGNILTCSGFITIIF